MSLEVKEPKSVRAFFEELEADMGFYDGVPAVDKNQDALKYKGAKIALKHVEGLVRADVLDSVMLTPDQMSIVRGALYEAVQIHDISSPAFRGTFQLLPSFSAPLLAIAAYLNTLITNKPVSTGLGENGTRENVAAVLKK